MNDEVIKEFLISLGFDVNEQSLAKANALVKNVAESIQGDLEKVKAPEVGDDNIATWVKWGAAITAGAAAMGYAAVKIKDFVGSTADAYDAVQDLSERVDISVNEIMRLGYAADLTDSSSASLQGSLMSLTRIAGMAAQGIGRGAAIFKQLGIEAKNADGTMKPTAQLMSEIGAKIKDLSKGEQIGILSRLGIDPTLVKMMTQDISGLTKEFDDLYAAAGINADQAGALSSDFMDDAHRLGKTMDTVKDAIAINIMGATQDGMNTLRKMIIENMGTVIKIAMPIIKSIMTVAESFFILARRGGQGIGILLGWIAKADEATGGMVKAIAAIGVAWKILSKGFLSTPLGQLISLGLAIALLVDDFLGFQDGGDSLIDWSGNMGTALKVLTVLLGVLGSVIAGVAIQTTAVTLAMNAWAIATKVAGVAQALFNAIISANPIALFIKGVILLVGALWYLIENWAQVKAWIGEFFSWVNEKVLEWTGFDLGKIWDSFLIGLKEAWGKVVSFGTMLSDTLSGFGIDLGSPQLVNAPSLSAPLLPQSAGGQSVAQNTSIVINGATDPQATANAVGGAQNQVNADLTRNLGAMVR